MSKMGYIFRVASSGLMYQKVLRLTKSSNEDGLNGRIINILSNDLGMFDIALGFIHDIWKGEQNFFFVFKI